MDNTSGKLASIFLVAVVLSIVAAWLIARRYRHAMRGLMSAPLEASPKPDAVAATTAGAAPVESTEGRVATATSLLGPPAAFDLAANQRAAVRLTLTLFVISAFISLTVAVIEHLLALPGESIAWKRVTLLAFIDLWPTIPALGIVWRWTRWQTIGALLLWFVLCFGLALWRSVDRDSASILIFLAWKIGPAMLLIALLFLGDATRAIAPWLLPVMFGFAWASHAGLDALSSAVNQRAGWLMALTSWLDVYAVLALAAVLPWLVAWWPLKAFGRVLARWYAKKRLSELGVLFTSVWAIALLMEMLGAYHDLQAGAVLLLMPLAWVPVGFWVASAVQSKSGRPPTLLVLRVFRRDAEVQQLFDRVIERWRLTGNTVLIAGTDLADRTLDADDIFAFIDGRLAERFIRDPAEVAPRIAAFDLARDVDGRYRINECYCHDTTWQAALDALVRASDVVLMDLRGFQAHNAGCLHELSVLARQTGLRRVVVLTDAVTDRDTATQAVGEAAPDRFVWLDASRLGAHLVRDVLQKLFAGRAPSPEPTRHAAAGR
jgi:hypothetical protein